MRYFAHAVVVLFFTGCSTMPFSLGDVDSVEVVDRNNQDRASKGETLLVSITAEQVVQTLLNEFRVLALKSFPTGSWNNYGPDAAYRMITIRCKRGEIVLCSWHSIAELHPNVVALSKGLVSLDGRSRDDLLAADDQEYVAKRTAFDIVEKRLFALSKKREK